MRTLRYGLIGFAQGYYATTYTRVAAARKDVEVVGVCDLGQPVDYVEACAELTAERFAEELGVPLYHKLDELLGKNLDAVMITSETCEHAAHALAAIQRGIHILIGKPMTLRADEVRQMIETAAGKPLVILPGQPARYEDGVIAAREQIARGAIGRPIMGRVFVNHPAMVNHEWERDEQRSGGPLGEFGYYCCDLIRWMMGAEPAEVFAYADNFCTPEIQSPDNLKILVRFTNGSLGSMDCSSSIRFNYPFLDLECIGETGVVRTQYHNYPAVMQRTDHVELAPIRYSPMNEREMHHFLDCVQGKDKPRMLLRDAIQVARMIDAIRESLRLHKPVSLA